LLSVIGGGTTSRIVLRKTNALIDLQQALVGRTWLESFVTQLSDRTFKKRRLISSNERPMTHVVGALLVE